MLAWSQSTETTGSFGDTDCVEKEDLVPEVEEAIAQVEKPELLYTK